MYCCRSQWSRGLRRRSAAARLLRFWVLIPPGAWTFVCCVCCHVEVSATSWWLVQRSPTDCGPSCVISKPHERGGPGPLGAVAPKTTCCWLPIVLPNSRTSLLVGFWSVIVASLWQDWEHLLQSLENRSHSSFIVSLRTNRWPVRGTSWITSLLSPCAVVHSVTCKIIYSELININNPY